MTVPSAMTALQAHLQADTALVTLLSAAARVYTRELPAAESPLQPRKAVVIAASGGLGHASYLRLGHPRFDIKSFGETPFEAERVDLAVFEALRDLGRRAEIGEALLHDAVLEGGPIPGRDRALNDAPFVLSVWRLMASQEAVA